jgi:uncharacterized protein (TIGR02172 family)
MENMRVHEKGRLIGRGTTAEVYEWGKDRVLKLFYERLSDTWINNEIRIGNAVFEAGVPAPAVLDTVVVNGRRGAIFERIPGQSMMRMVGLEPWKLFSYSKTMAGFHYKIHKCHSDGLQSQKEKLEFAINRSADLLGSRTKRILEYLYSLPDGDSVCHGDFHFDNVLVCKNRLVAIDWTNAYYGNPLGDVARTCLMMNSPAFLTSIIYDMILPYKSVKIAAYQAYLNEYIRVSNSTPEAVDAWMLPVAAVRLRDKIPGEQKWLLNIINQRLSRLHKNTH